MKATFQERVNGIDPRIKLLLVVAMGNAAFFAPGNLGLLWCFLLAAAILVLAREYRTAVAAGIVFLVALGLDALSVRYLGTDMLGLTIGMFSFMLARLAPLFMLAAWALETTETDQVITAMQKMRMPKGLTVAIAVAFRFVPTVRYEFRSIKNTMKLRGVGLTWKRVLLHPLTTMEYSLVPLLMRSMKIGDDLAASALTRGLARPVSRTSIQAIKLGGFDWLVAASVLALLLAGFSVLAS